ESCVGAQGGERELEELRALEQLAGHPLEPAQLLDEFFVGWRRRWCVVPAELRRTRSRNRDESRQRPHLAAQCSCKLESDCGPHAVSEQRVRPIQIRGHRLRQML